MTRTKKILTLVLVIIFVLGAVSGVMAASTLKSITAYLNDTLGINYKGIAFVAKQADGSTLLPITYNNRTYVPLRAFADAVDLKVNYEQATKKITLSQYPGTTYKIQADAKGTSISAAAASGAFAAVDGLQGWSLAAEPDKNLDVFIYNIAPNGALLPMHVDAANEWYCYVLDGAGQIQLGDANQKQVGVIDFKKGDTLQFDKNTMHAWKIGDKGTTLLFIKVKPAPGK